MKALLFADLHLHAHKERIDRLDDCLAVLDWVFKEADNHNCRYIFFLGDLFHERSKIDVLNYLRTFEIFIKHMIEDAADRDVFLLVGNHDMYHRQRWDVNSIKPLTAIPRVHIIDKPFSQNISDDLSIDWLPHTENPFAEMERLKNRNESFDGKKLLFAHIAVSGAILNHIYGLRSDVIVEYDNDMSIVDADSFENWDATFLGHYHKEQKLAENVEYIGSPLQLSFGEAFQQKHLILLDLETLEKQYIKNEISPRHLILTPQDIEDEIYDLENSFVRVGVENIGATEVVELKRKLSKMNLLYFNVKEKDKKTNTDETVIEEAKMEFVEEGKMIDSYLEKRGVPSGMKKSVLSALGNKIVECVETQT